MTEKDAMLGFVRHPDLEKANSALELGVSVPEMDEVAAEWDFIVGDAECDLAERDFHNRSLSNSSKGMAAQFSFTNGRPQRALR